MLNSRFGLLIHSDAGSLLIDFGGHLGKADSYGQGKYFALFPKLDHDISSLKMGDPEDLAVRDLFPLTKVVFVNWKTRER